MLFVSSVNPPPSKQSSSKMSEPEPKTDENKKDWSKRFTDPMVMMAWRAEIVVYPANKDKGEMTGWRSYPDGTRESFTIA